MKKTHNQTNPDNQLKPALNKILLSLEKIDNKLSQKDSKKKKAILNTFTFLQLLGAILLMWSTFRERGEINAIKNLFAKDDRIMYDYNQALNRFIAFSQNIKAAEKADTTNDQKKFDLCLALSDYSIMAIQLRHLAILRKENFSKYLSTEINDRWLSYVSTNNVYDETGKLVRLAEENSIGKLYELKLKNEFEAQTTFDIMMDMRSAGFKLKEKEEHISNVNDWVFKLGTVFSLVSVLVNFKFKNI